MLDVNDLSLSLSTLSAPPRLRLEVVAADAQPKPGDSSFAPVTAEPETTSGGALLVAAYLAVWIVVMAFVFLAWRRTKELSQKVSTLEKAIEKAIAVSTPTTRRSGNVPKGKDSPTSSDAADAESDPKPDPKSEPKSEPKSKREPKPASSSDDVPAAQSTTE